MYPKNLTVRPEDMDTERDAIFMEDPNASRGQMPPQLDFPFNLFPQVGTPPPNPEPPVPYALNPMKEEPVVATPQEPRPLPVERPEMPQPMKQELDPAKLLNDYLSLTGKQEAPKGPSQMDELEAILNRRSDAGLMNTMLRAGMMANQGLAASRGAKVGVDENALQALEKQGNIPLENFSTKVKSQDILELQDPNSDISQVARLRFIDALKKSNPNIDVSAFENLSASQLKQLGAVGDDSLKALALELQRERLQLQRQAEEGKFARQDRNLEFGREKLENTKREQDRIPQEAGKALTGADTTLAALKDLRKYKPLFDTGPIKNRVEDFKRLFGKEEPDFAGFKSRIAATLSAYVKSMSGTAASDKEVERLDEVIPKASDSDESFITKLNSFEDQVKTSKKAIMDSYKKLDYDLRGYQKDYDELSGASSEPTKEASGKKEVERLDKKTGKIAIFDTSTNPPKFLRYK